MQNLRKEPVSAFKDLTDAVLVDTVIVDAALDDGWGISGGVKRSGPF